MRVFEYGAALIFALLGLRSLVHWVSRPYESRRARDQLLYALFVTGRVGLWLALGGLFLIYGVTRTRGRAFIDDVRDYDWFFIVFVVLSAVQLVAGFFLGGRPTER